MVSASPHCSPFLCLRTTTKNRQLALRAVCVLPVAATCELLLCSDLQLLWPRLYPDTNTEHSGKGRRRGEVLQQLNNPLIDVICIVVFRATKKSSHALVDLHCLPSFHYGLLGLQLPFADLHARQGSYLYDRIRSYTIVCTIVYDRRLDMNGNGARMLVQNALPGNRGAWPLGPPATRNNRCCSYHRHELTGRTMEKLEPHTILDTVQTHDTGHLANKIGRRSLMTLAQTRPTGR